MIVRTIVAVAVAVASLGLISDRVAAQMGQYPVMPVAYTGMDGGCSDCAPMDATSCGGCESADCNDRWISPGRFGQHDPCCSCPRCKPRHSWASFDALLWWGKGRNMPVLLTTSPPGTDGVLPNAGVLFGGGHVGNRVAAGARVDFGFWFDDCETLGMGARVWGIQGNRQGLYETSPDGSTVLARPFLNAISGLEDSLLVSSPGLLTGDIQIQTTSNVISTEAYLRSNMLTGRGYHVDLLGGYHFMRLDDDLLVDTDSVSIDPGGAVAVGTGIHVVDTFGARNEFHGGELGLVAEFRHRCWTLTGLAKTSVGNMQQQVAIDGWTMITPPASTTVTHNGGMLALPTNMGTYSRSVTAIIPEVGFNLAYEYRSWLRLTIGYTALYWTEAAFAGDQIDRVVNRTQFNGGLLLGPARPAFAFRSSDYWMHGMSLGATITY